MDIYRKISRLLAVFLIMLFILPPVALSQVIKLDTAKGQDGFRYLFRTGKKKDWPEVYDTISLSDFYDMSLEELESVKASGVPSELEKFINSLISTSTQKSLPSRYSPNIVTLITEEEIRNLGARDLIDVLRLIPGFHFAQDRNGNVGLGMRGNWANEGKVLLMIDGKEMNDLYTAHLYFGNHYPVDMIKRIEILRGPGSAIYGGFAEFGVINIVTRKAEQNAELSFQSTFGRMGPGVDRGSFQVYGARRWKNAGLSGFLITGNAQRSNRLHYGFYSCEADSAVCFDTLGVGKYAGLGGQSDLFNTILNLDFTWKGLSVSNLSNFYTVTDVTSLDSKGNRPMKFGTASNFFEMKYKLRAGHNLTITPKVNMSIQTPLEENTPYSRALESNPGYADSIAIAMARLRTGLNFNYDVNHRINVIAGLDTYGDHALNPDTLESFYRNKAPQSYSNTAFYGQAIFRLDPFNLVAGARYEFSSLYKPAFSPRLGITRKFKKAHLKFLISDAYRSPTLGNIFYSFDGNYSILPDSSGITQVGRGLKPEKTLVFEAEFGYQFGSKTFLTANVFDITTRNPIVYTYYQDETIRELYDFTAGILAYQNFKKSGTNGLEIDFLFKDDWGYLNLNYSFYTAEFKPRISAYTVSTFNRDAQLRETVDDSYLLAFPKHKLNLNWCYYIKDDFTVNLSSTFFGPRWGYDIDLYGPGLYDVDGRLIKKRFSFLTNVFFRYDNIFTKGLEAGAGVYDIFNKGTDYLQPYFGMAPPLPGSSRELYLRLSYRIPFGKKDKPSEN
ncbi:MAG: TonB-dependent receptor plug domain-containing protein [Bacteroidales bacterium]|nr:TonB-dependent receptor plug domain-containing protein [Bacteroidales bacterium]